MNSKTAMFLVIITLFSLHASADPISDKLTALEKTVTSMQTDSIARNTSVASALSTIEQLKQDNLTIQGNLEADAHIIKQQQDEIARLRRDMEDRIASLEDKLEIYDQQISKAVAKVLPAAANEAESYQKALALVHQSDFMSAIASFRAYLKVNPKSELSDNAQYWIAECYYALKDYQKAIKEFQVIVDKYPRSDKTAGAILKQGYSFAELDMPEEAKTFLSLVIKSYPNTGEAIKAKEKIDRLDQKSAAATTPVSTMSNAPLLDSTSNIPLAPGLKDQLKANQTTQSPAIERPTRE